MKLIAHYYLIDGKGERVLELSHELGPEYMAQIRNIYSNVYSGDAPFSIVAVDVLDEEHAVIEEV